MYFAILLYVFISVFFVKRVKNFDNYNKFLLHIILNFFFFQFFYLINVYQSNCMIYFYDIIFTSYVKWNFLLRYGMDDNFTMGSYHGNIAYYNAPDTQVFKAAGVSSYILANNCMMFFIRLGFFLFYVIVKLLNMLGVKRFVHSYVNCYEFNCLICLILFMHMEEVSFPILNLKMYEPSTNYFFVFNLLISIGYVIVFWVLWIFCAIRLLDPKFSFDDTKNVN